MQVDGDDEQRFDHSASVINDERDACRLGQGRIEGALFSLCYSRDKARRRTSASRPSRYRFSIH